MAENNLAECLKSLLREIIREELTAAELHNGKLEPLEVDGKEAARLLDLPLSWVMSAARTGKLKCIKHGHHVRFRVEDLKSFIQK
jgi:excisionase family DNA binding protein